MTEQEVRALMAEQLKLLLAWNKQALAVDKQGLSADLAEQARLNIETVSRLEAYLLVE